MPPRRYVSIDGLFRMPSTSHAVVAGPHVWVAGLLGTVGDGLDLAPGGVGPQTTQAIRNVERVLQACDASLDDVVRAEVYLVNPDDFLAMDHAFAEHLPVQPARVAVYASALPLGALVELTATAYLA